LELGGFGEAQNEIIGGKPGDPFTGRSTTRRPQGLNSVFQ